MSGPESHPLLLVERGHSAAARRDRALFMLLLGWTFVSCVFPLHDTDFWWHLRTGELMWERGGWFQWPLLDWYTFTDFDKPWIDLHWGFQLLIALLYHAGGANLVVLVKASVLTAAVGIAFRAAGDTLPTWQRVLCWVPAVIAVSGRGYERPEMLTQLFLALWLWIVWRLDRQPRLIWWLPLIQVLWVNCHALFVLGIVVGGCYAADRAARVVADGRWGLQPASPAPSLRTLWRGGLLIALAAFMNPYFEEGALFPLVLYRKFSVEQEFYAARIGEFTQPIAFLQRSGAAALLNPYFLAQLILWLITTLSFVRLLRYGRWSPLRVLLFAGFSHLAWEASRNTNIFALVAGVLLTANLADLRALRRTAPQPSRSATAGAATARSTSRGRRRNSHLAPAESAATATPPQPAAAVEQAAVDPMSERRGRLAAVTILCALILLVVSGVWNRAAEGNKPFALGELPGWFIHAPARFASQPGFPLRAIVANNGQAAVYIYHAGPQRQVFMDGRLEVVTQHTFEQYEVLLAMLARGDRRWEPQLRHEGQLPVIVLDSRYSRPQINGLLLTPGWRLVFADPTGAVFLSDPQADALGLPAVDPEPLKYPPNWGESG